MSLNNKNQSEFNEAAKREREDLYDNGSDDDFTLGPTDEKKKAKKCKTSSPEEYELDATGKVFAAALLPAPYFHYRDHSTEDDDDPLTPVTQAGHIPCFPQKMHAILASPRFHEIVEWDDHGRSFRILKPKQFEFDVLPLFFEHAKFSSFVRQANGWGFRRLASGVNRHSYYQEYFLRSMPWLCKKMRRPKVGEKKPISLEHEPDLCAISQEFPVRDEPMNRELQIVLETIKQGPRARMPVHWAGEEVPPARSSVATQEDGKAVLENVGSTSSPQAEEKKVAAMPEPQDDGKIVALTLKPQSKVQANPSPIGTAGASSLDVLPQAQNQSPSTHSIPSVNHANTAAAGDRIQQVAAMLNSQAGNNETAAMSNNQAIPNLNAIFNPQALSLAQLINQNPINPAAARDNLHQVAAMNSLIRNNGVAATLNPQNMSILQAMLNSQALLTNNANQNASNVSSNTEPTNTAVTGDGVASVLNSQIRNFAPTVMPNPQTMLNPQALSLTNPYGMRITGGTVNSNSHPIANTNPMPSSNLDLLNYLHSSMQPNSATSGGFLSNNGLATGPSAARNGHTDSIQSNLAQAVAHGQPVPLAVGSSGIPSQSTGTTDAESIALMQVLASGNVGTQSDVARADVRARKRELALLKLQAYQAGVWNPSMSFENGGQGSGKK